MMRLNLPSMQDPGLMRSMNCLNVWPALLSFSMLATTSSWCLRSLKNTSSNQTSSSWLDETVLAMLLKPSKVSVLASWKNSSLALAILPVHFMSLVADLHHRFMVLFRCSPDEKIHMLFLCFHFAQFTISNTIKWFS